jgi:uncharacterized membrane protein YkoI
MNPRRRSLPLAAGSLAIGLLLGAPLAFAQATAPAAPAAAARASATLSADQVRAMLMRQGYTQVKELELDDGHWKVKARDAQGDWDKLRLDARTGQQIDDGHTSGLTSDQILEGLKAKGYSGFGTLKFDDGEWEAKAVNAANRPVELHIDANTGQVTREEDAD